MIITQECPHCKNSFESDTRHRKRFCNSSCAASFNNKHRIRKKIQKICLKCSKPFLSKGTKGKFCSLQCGAQYRSGQGYLEITSGERIMKNTPKHIKPFILKEQNDECAICNMGTLWNNQPLVFILDHINGDSDNNLRKNLRVICPNCDSQLDTFKGKNVGQGRHSRRQRYKEGKSF